MLLHPGPGPAAQPHRRQPGPACPNCLLTPALRRPPAGALGTGRNYVTGSAELRLPLVSPVEATLFGDWGSDLDSGASIPGDPAGARGKPGGRAGCTRAVEC